MRPPGRLRCRLSGKFQSTHSLRSATRAAKNIISREWFQSTHSLRSATFRGYRGKLDAKGFNPRTPCGVRLSTCILSAYHSMFQSTHSLRSATIMRKQADMPILFQSTHSLRSATGIIDCPVLAVQFQSTHSLRSATLSGTVSRLCMTVSIHALLAECDNNLTTL